MNKTIIIIDAYLDNESILFLFKDVISIMKNI